jgi:hypothetical protein
MWVGIGFGGWGPALDFAELLWSERTADPPTALRSGRDDNSVVERWKGCVSTSKLQIARLSTPAANLPETPLFARDDKGEKYFAWHDEG